MKGADLPSGDMLTLSLEELDVLRTAQRVAAGYADNADELARLLSMLGLNRRLPDAAEHAPVPSKQTVESRRPLSTARCVECGVEIGDRRDPRYKGAAFHGGKGLCTRCYQARRKKQQKEGE